MNVKQRSSLNIELKKKNNLKVVKGKQLFLPWSTEVTFQSKEVCAFHSLNSSGQLIKLLYRSNSSDGSWGVVNRNQSGLVS